MRKNVYITVIAIIFCITLVGCGNTNSNSSTSNYDSNYTKEEKEKMDKYDDAMICALAISRKYNVKNCSPASFKEVGEDFYTLSCGQVTIRIIDGNFDIYSSTTGWAQLHGYCDSYNNPVAVSNSSSSSSANNTTNNNSSNNSNNTNSNNSSYNNTNSSEQTDINDDSNDYIDDKIDSFMQKDESSKPFEVTMKIDDGYNNQLADIHLLRKSGECSGCKCDIYLNNELQWENQSCSLSSDWDEEIFGVSNYNVGTNTVKVDMKKNGSIVKSLTGNFNFDFDKIPAPKFNVFIEYNTYSDKENLSIFTDSNGCNQCGFILYINGVKRESMSDTIVDLEMGRNEIVVEVANKFGKKSCKKVYITRFEENPDVSFVNLGEWEISDC